LPDRHERAGSEHELAQHEKLPVHLGTCPIG